MQPNAGCNNRRTGVRVLVSYFRYVKGPVRSRYCIAAIRLKLSRAARSVEYQIPQPISEKSKKMREIRTF